LLITVQSSVNLSGKSPQVDTVALVVIMSATKEEIQLGRDRRDRIINFILEYFTGPEIDRKTLGHFRFIAEMFGITAKVKEMCGASSIQGRQELAVTIALAALNVAIDDSPPPPSERQLERRERREAAKQFEASLAGKIDADGGACVAEPDKSVKPPRAELSRDDLERVRKSQRERQARWRAKAKCEKTGNAQLKSRFLEFLAFTRLAFLIRTLPLRFLSLCTEQ
jgi:hypothetical protein